MTTSPLGEARAPRIPTHGDSRPTDTSTVGSESQDPLLADVPTANGATVSPEQQDVDQASIEQVISQSSSESGDKDKHEAAVGDSQEPKEATALLDHQASNAPQMPTSSQDPAWEGLVQNASMSLSPQTSQRDPLGEEETPQTSGTPDSDQELAPTMAAAKAQFPGKDTQPAVSSADSGGQEDTETTGTTTTAEGGTLEGEPEGPETLNSDTEASTTAESQGGPEEDLVGGSEHLQAEQLPPARGGSAPPSPGPREVAPGRRPLDISLYTANEDNSYMRSETTMGMATAFLASGHSSATDVLQSSGPSLRSVSSILGNTFSSGLMTGTGSALHSVTHMLETMEQRTIGGIRSAMRYLISHLSPRRAPARPDPD